MILDTDALSALAERDEDLIRRIRTAPRLYVTLVSLGEYHYGVSRSTKPRELIAWLEAFLEHAEILSPALSTLPHYADVRRELRVSGKPIPANDCWIAALVREHGIPIASRDTHFDHVRGVKRVSW
jgi:predicted nucleic acid-binding protein